MNGFDFDAKFNITHFTLLIIKPRQDPITKIGSGGTLTADMHSVLNTVSPGTTVVFSNIIAVGPDGVQQEIDGIALTAN